MLVPFGLDFRRQNNVMANAENGFEEIAAVLGSWERGVFTA